MVERPKLACESGGAKEKIAIGDAPSDTFGGEKTCLVWQTTQESMEQRRRRDLTTTKKALEKNMAGRTKPKASQGPGDRKELAFSFLFFVSLRSTTATCVNMWTNSCPDNNLTADFFLGVFVREKNFFV